MTTPQDPAVDSTVRLDPRPVAADPTVQPALETTAVEPTVRLASEGSAADPTLQLTGQAAGTQDDVDSATFLDPEAWPTERPAPQDGLRRFGPGVPPQAAAAWHGTAAVPPAGPPRRRRGRWTVLPLVVLLAVLGYLGWQRYGRPVAVTGVAGRTDPAGPPCDGTAVISGSLQTDGGAGVVTYRWLRSDGTDSGVLSQQVPSGRHTTDVVLRWTFQGHGTMQATATLQILTPSAHSAVVSFPYTCS